MSDIEPEIALVTNLQKILKESLFLSAEKSIYQRTCSMQDCNEKIPARQAHLCYFVHYEKNKDNRFNICRKCAIKILNKEIETYSRIIEVFTKEFQKQESHPNS